MFTIEKSKLVQTTGQFIKMCKLLYRLHQLRLVSNQFVGDIETDIRNYLLETLKSLDMTPLAMEIMPDHIHLLVDCKPQLRLSDAIKILKGNIARWLFLKHPEIKKQLWGGHLWNPSYFVATVSDRTLEQVKYYIDNQKKK